MIKSLEDALTQYFNAKIRVTLEKTTHPISSPAAQQQAQHQKSHETAVEHLKGDDFFQQLQQEFSGDVVKDSVASTATE